MPLSPNEVTQSCFGAGFYDQGRGFNVALELFALARGTHSATGVVLPPDDGHPVALDRHGHDFARRLPYRDGDDPLFGAEDLTHLKGASTPDTLQSLIENLTVPVVGRRIVKFNQRMLLPYYGELIHYDAVERRRGGRRTVSIERYTFRGPGGLAHKILRTDPDKDRLAANQAGLERLVADSHSPLGRLALALHEHDAAKPQRFADKEELDAFVVAGTSPWPDVLRMGVRNIVERLDDAPRRVDRLLHFVPYCMARHQLALATTAASHVAMVLPVQVGVRGSGSLRRLSQRSLVRANQAIKDGLLATARQLAGDPGGPDDPGWQEWMAFSHNANERTKSPRGFFTQTLASVGAINAPAGVRHFTLKLPLLDALVAALLRPGQERVFEELCESLDSTLGIVVDDVAASAHGMTADVNASEFRENAEALARDLDALGLLTAYSDATRMVKAEVRR